MLDLLKTEGRARRGVFHTVHGDIQTPVFMNVGTCGAIKGGISSGKTALCMDMIEKLHKTNKCIMLVNDKYSFEAEKSFIKMM